MQIPDSFFEDEVRDGFYVSGLMKHSWAAQMEILADIDKVCRKYNIRWFADRGTLLGAVRHGGYIPWDDDLDICMMREDYVLFNAVAEKELPKGYYIPHERTSDHRTLTTVYNCSKMPVSKEHLEKFHGYPLCAAIDIFVLDYIAPDPEDEEYRVQLASILIATALSFDEEERNEKRTEEVLIQIEEMLQVKLDREKPMQEQLFVLLEQVFSLYKPEEAKEVACMVNWVGWKGWKFPIECYQESVMLPFEFTEIAVPKLYLEAVKIQFGENYMEPYRAGGGHDYPSYKGLEKMITDASDIARNPLSLHQISQKDLERPAWNDNGVRSYKLANSFVQTAANIHIQILEAMKTGNLHSLNQILETCQNSALQIGTLLEKREGEDCPTVRLLEEYCELLYLLHEAPDASTYERLNAQLFQIEESVRTDVRPGREIAFLPFHASSWQSLEPAWRAAQADPDCDVYVIPIPYYYKSLLENNPELHYDGNEFPDYVPITHYNHYDFKTRKPDVILINNPYDNCSFSTSVHPFFYSGNLLQYTGQLVYIPYFHMGEIEETDTRSIYNMRYYVSSPGVVHADKVILPSDRMRKTYIDYLTDISGEDFRSVWENKIVVKSFETR